jgi:hypothetical protein
VTRRLVTWAVVGALGTLGVAAAVDAVVGTGRPQTEARPEQTPAPAPPPAPETDLRSDLEQELFVAGIRGTLWWTDPTCHSFRAELPELEAVEGPEAACPLTVSPGLELGFDGAVWQAGQELVARCYIARIGVAGGSGDVVAQLPGCSPAWRPDGTLTYVSLGEVMEWQPGGQPSLLLGKATLARALRPLGVAARPELLSVREIAWLDERRFAAIVRLHRRSDTRDAVAILDVAARRAYGAPILAGSIGKLAASPAGRYVAAWFEGQGIRLFDRAGQPLGEPVAGTRALAWSPDERWAVFARERDLRFVALDGAARPIAVPILARDLAWLP